jgi:hypothetical protein
MWNDEQKQRFQALRTRERQQELTAPEKAELARMIQELEEEEAVYLRPANQRLDAKIRRTQEQNRILKTLSRRQQTIIRRMERLLAVSQQEQQSIDREVQRILAEQSPQVGAGL